MPTEPDSPVALRLISYALRAGAAILILALAIGIFAWLVGTRRAPAHTPATIQPIAVRAVTIRPVSVPRVWEGYGTARAMESADISSQLVARVIERPEGIEPGAAVEAGQLIVRLDPLDFQQRIEASQALIRSWEAQIAALDIEERRLTDQLELMQEEVRLEERELERITSVVEQRAANAVEIDRRMAILNRVRRDQLRSMVASERANLRLAQENLERATVRSPIAGVLQEVFAEPGELLSVGAPIARVVDLSRVEVPLRLPVSASTRVRAGDTVEMGPDSPREGAPAVWRGTIARIAPEADPSSRTITVFVEVRQDPGLHSETRAGVLLPGQFVIGRVTTGLEERLVVPRAAVDRDRVMIVEPGERTRAREAPVRVLGYVDLPIPELDPRETEWAVLESGPAAGTQVITSNLDELRDGTPVRVESGVLASDGNATLSGNSAEGGAGGGGRGGGGAGGGGS